MNERPSVCLECGSRRSEKWGVIFHRFGCSHNPKPSPGPFKRPDRMSPPPDEVERKRQDREAAALRHLSAPVEVRERCTLHPTEPAEDCRPCEIAWKQAQERRAIFGGDL